MKTKPIGVRFDEDLLKVLEKDGVADSPQKALNFLTEFYWSHQAEQININPIKKPEAKKESNSIPQTETFFDKLRKKKLGY